jgi:hypothetical protein
MLLKSILSEIKMEKNGQAQVIFKPESFIRGLRTTWRTKVYRDEEVVGPTGLEPVTTRL